MTDQAISYQAVPAGVPVLTATGHEIGTLEHVLQIPEEDLFDGLVITTKDGLRFVDADQVQVITASYIRSTLDDALQDTGENLGDRLGRLFRRARWIRDSDGS